MKYVAGKSSEALQRDSVRKRSSSSDRREPHGPLPLAIASIIECAPRSQLYPGVEPLDLRAAIAASTGLSAAHMVMREWVVRRVDRPCRDRAFSQETGDRPQRSFVMYQIGVEAAGATVVAMAHP